MSSTPEAYIVVGLGYGDEGKGSITDALTRVHKAKHVIRYNGGPQAAHHVVTDEGQLHCFAQLTSGTFTEEVHSFLGPEMLINPLNMLEEARILEEEGVKDPLSRVYIDPACLVVTPYHRQINRMKESLRGTSRHGSCGQGVGQAWMDAQKEGYPVLRFEDLFDKERCRQLLKWIWMMKVDLAEQWLDLHPEREDLRESLHQLQYALPYEVLCEQYLDFAYHSGVHKADVASDLSVHHNHQTLIFEGAQGVLLDRERGFWPHVTPSDTTAREAHKILERADLPHTPHVLGILRGYASRHGAGPFVSEVFGLEQALPEQHNGTNRWQGDFRVGWFDLVKARYALKVAKEVNSIALTQLDRLAMLEHFEVCTAYEYTGFVDEALHRFFDVEETEGRVLIHDILVPPKVDRSHQEELTRRLRDCSPITKTFESWPTQERVESLCPSLETFISFLESPQGLQTPISILSFGPTAGDKYFLQDLRPTTEVLLSSAWSSPTKDVRIANNACT